MPLIELHFPVLGSTLPTDHGYALYTALSHLVPPLHDRNAIRIAPIAGQYVGNRILQLVPLRSRLRIRLPTEDIPTLLPLAGKQLRLDGCTIRVGVPQVRALIPAPNLIARMVVIKSSSPRRDPADKNSRDPNATKRYLDPASFLDAVRHDLARREIHAQADLPLHETGPRAGQPRRHILRIHGKTIVGFGVLVQGLTAEESVRLQEEGIGGRGKMGCGFFTPTKGGQE
jgi:hypothetical protein